MAKRVVLRVDEIVSPSDSTRKAIYYKEGVDSSTGSPRPPVSGDVLVFNAGNQCFSNEPMTSVGGVATAVISTEMGIDVTTTNSGQDMNYRFAATAPSTSGIKVSEADDADISSGGLQDGDHFMWNATAQKWVNMPSAKHSLKNETDTNGNPITVAEYTY